MRLFLPFLILALVGCVQEPEGTRYVPDAPTVIHTVPAHLETGVSLTTTVTATFSEAMDPATLNVTTFILLRATAFGADTVRGAVAYNAGDSTATFTPDDSLLPGQTYMALLKYGILDAECDTLADTSWTFTTPNPVPDPPLDLVEQDVHLLAITLQWGTVPGATSYGLQVSTSPVFATTVYDATGLTATSQAVSLFPGTTYYWRVNAANNAGTSAWSVVESFVKQ
jgi:hypothetical protein